LSFDTCEIIQRSRAVKVTTGGGEGGTTHTDFWLRGQLSHFVSVYVYS